MLFILPSFLPFWPRKVLSFRTETGQLVLKTSDLITNEQNKSLMLELGAGCGLLAIYSVCNLEAVKCLACDCKVINIKAARLNALSKLGMDKKRKLKFKASYWFNNLPTLQFNLVVSNPPYVSSHSFVQSSVRRRNIVMEDRSSLVNDGNNYHNIIRSCPRFLIGGGKLMLEHGANHGRAIRNLLHKCHFTQITTLRDCGRVQRISIGFYYSKIL